MEVYYIDQDITGTCYLAKEGNDVIIIDPGMAFMGEKVVERVKNILGDQPVNAIFLTHSHYDHVAAVPYVKKEWPQAPVYSAEYAAGVFAKPAAQKMMGEMSRAAAKGNKSDWTPENPEYDCRLIHTDVVVHDGDVTMIGNMKVKTIATVGHTKCSVSFMVNDSAMFSSETIGLEGSHETGYLPAFLIGYKAAVESLDRTRAAKPEMLYMPHRGLVDHPGEEYWNHLETGLAHTKDMIVRFIAEHDDFNEQIVCMEEEFWAKTEKGTWPKEAFDINAAAMLKTISKEFPDEIAEAKSKLQAV